MPMFNYLRRQWLVALTLFVISLLVLFFASLQLYWPGKSWTGAKIMDWSGEALALVKGQGHRGHGKLTIDSLAEPGVAIATISMLFFRAEDYPVVQWSISGANTKPGTQVEFLWRTAENPDRVFARPLEWTGGAVAPLQMAGDTHWHGGIVWLGLMVRAPMDAPLVVEGVKLEPFSPLRIVRREWFDAVPWLGTSINFVGGDFARQWTAPLPFVATALGLAILGYQLLVRRKILAPDVRIMWALVFMAWFALDMRWQLDLWQKLGLTEQRYAGKSWEQKHLAADDGQLFDLMQQIRAKLPPTASRVFLFADDDYMRGRGAYHLYPFNVMTGRDLLPAAQFRSGDFIIILGKDEVQFDPAQHLLEWGSGQKLHADLLLLAANNVLLRVR